MKRSRPELTMLRFQLHSGARVAIRTLAPLAAGFTAATVITGSPLVVLGPIAAVLFPSGPASSSGLIAACVLGATAAALAPRLKPGMSGWIRHLPATARTHRRAAAAGLAIAFSPIVMLVAAAGVMALPASPQTTALRLLGIPVATLAAAYSALPVGATSRMLAALAVALSFVGLPWALVAGTATLGVADRRARDTDFKPQEHRRRFRSVSPRGSVLWVTITVRSLGTRVVSFCAVSLLILVPLLFFVNNNGLTSSQSHIAVRFAGLIAATFIMAAVADGLARRRPPWPWVRSLPWSAARRVSMDAAITGAAALPALLAAGIVRPATLPSMVAVLPVLALRAAGAIRSAPERASGASGQLMAEGFLLAAATAVLPVVAWLAIPATAMAVRAAATAEKNQDVSRWHELHHLAAGDSTSWSDS